MSTELPPQERAAAELAAHHPVRPAAEVVDSLWAGWTQLRELLTKRVHKDVELQFGVDSMVAPLGAAHEFSQLQRAGLEMDAYAVVVVADEVAHGGYVERPAEWFLPWTTRLLFGDGREQARDERAAAYGGLSDKGRRLRFASMLQQVLPESIKAPSLLFLLFPLSVRIVVAVAFGDMPRAQQLRAEQITLLPAIGDCHDCRGRVLGNEEWCRRCGNPLWTFAWLRSD